MIGAVKNVVLLLSIPVGSWVLSVFCYKPRFSDIAKCHECETVVENAPECENCGAGRPDDYEYWARQGFVDWFRANLQHPMAVIRGDSVPIPEEGQDR